MTFNSQYIFFLQYYDFFYNFSHQILSLFFTYYVFLLKLKFQNLFFPNVYYNISNMMVEYAFMPSVQKNTIIRRTVPNKLLQQYKQIDISVNDK